jgi:hypothetical protein
LISNVDSRQFFASKLISAQSDKTDEKKKTIRSRSDVCASRHLVYVNLSCFRRGWKWRLRITTATRRGDHSERPAGVRVCNAGEWGALHGQQQLCFRFLCAHVPDKQNLL